jgi:hypothetical protein
VNQRTAMDNALLLARQGIKLIEVSANFSRRFR